MYFLLEKEDANWFDDEQEASIEMIIARTATGINFLKFE